MNHASPESARRYSIRVSRSRVVACSASAARVSGLLPPLALWRTWCPSRAPPAIKRALIEIVTGHRATS